MNTTKTPLHSHKLHSHRHRHFTVCFLKGHTSLAELATYRSAVSTARETTDTAPTAAQKEAGNYAKGRVVLHGLSIVIENPKGSYRRGTSASGKTWKTRMGADYGYFTRRHGSDKTPYGVDGDPVDVFIGPHPEAESVFIVNQVNRAGDFDEHKVILGARSEAEARKTYLSCYSAGWTGFGSIVHMTMPQFRVWLAGINNREFLDSLPVQKAVDRIGGKDNLTMDFSTPVQHVRDANRFGRKPRYADVAEKLADDEEVSDAHVRHFPVLAAEYGRHERWNMGQKVQIASGKHAGSAGILGDVELLPEHNGKMHFNVALDGGTKAKISEEHFDPVSAVNSPGRKCAECGAPSGNLNRCKSCVVNGATRENDAMLQEQQQKQKVSSDLIYGTAKGKVVKGEGVDTRTPSGASLTGPSSYVYIVDDSGVESADTERGAIFFEELTKAFTGEPETHAPHDPVIGLMPESHWAKASARLHPRKNVVYLNDSAAHAFHTAFLGDSRLHREGGQTGFDGAHAPAESLRFAADGYRNLASAPHIPFSDHSRAALRSQADVFDAAASRHPDSGAMILPRSEDKNMRPRFGDLRGTVRHERTHGRLDEAGAVPFPLPPTAKTKAALENHPAYHGAIAALKSQGYDPDDKPGLHEELAAHIAGGHHEDLGLSHDDAGALIGHLATHLAAVHGVDAVKHIFSGAHGVARRALRVHGLAKAFGIE